MIKRAYLGSCLRTPPNLLPRCQRWMSYTARRATCQIPKTVIDEKRFLARLGPLLGRGADGQVYKHRNLEGRVFKVSGSPLGHEARIGWTLSHPSLVKAHRLYLRKGKGAAIEMDRVHGDTVHHLACHKSVKLTAAQLNPLVSQLEDVCLYLFDRHMYWNDLHGGNLMLDPSLTHLYVIDYSGWESVPLGALPQQMHLLLQSSRWGVEKLLRLHPDHDPTDLNSGFADRMSWMDPSHHSAPSVQEGGFLANLRRWGEQTREQNREALTNYFATVRRRLTKL